MVRCPPIVLKLEGFPLLARPGCSWTPTQSSNRRANDKLVPGNTINKHIRYNKPGGSKLLRMSRRPSCAHIILYSIPNFLAPSDCPFIGSSITALLGAAIKSVITGVVIGDKLDNQIFGLSQLAPWKIKIHQLLSHGIYSLLSHMPLHAHMAFQPHINPSKMLFTDNPGIRVLGCPRATRPREYLLP